MDHFVGFFGHNVKYSKKMLEKIKKWLFEYFTFVGKKAFISFMINPILRSSIDIGETRTKIGHIITPGTNLVKAYNTSHPTESDKHLYWLYYDFYCHIIGYDNGYANVRIGTATSWISQDTVEEVVFKSKITTKTHIYKEPSLDSEVLGTIDVNEDIIIVDYHVNNFSEIYYQGKVGFVESSSTDFNFKQFTGKNDGEIAAELVKTKLGCQYEWAMSGPNTFDCSGLMHWAYNRLDRFIPRTSYVQAQYGKILKSEDELLPGDLITFCTDEKRPNVVSHVGMYIGDGKFIHASGSYKRVIESDLKTYNYSAQTMNRYWQD